MNVLIVNSSNIYGGGEYFTEKLTSSLGKKGIRVFTACKKNSPLHVKLEQSGIKCFGLNFPEKGAGQLLENIKALKKILNVEKIDIIHSNTGYDRTASGFASAATSAIHITNCHSLESLSHNLTHYIRNRYFTSHFIADGDSIRERLISENNIPPGKITTVYNGIEPKEMRRDITLRNKIRAEFGIRENEVLIGSVGRLVEFKGYKYLLSAFKILIEHKPDLKLIIVGDGELRKSLELQAETLQINNKIIFAGFREDLQALYSAFDIYVNSSLKNGGELFPFTILYAMAAEVPIVAADSGDIAKIIENNFNGFIIEEKSPIRISEKLMDLILNQNLRIKFSERSLMKLKNDFTQNLMVENIIKIYEILLLK